MSMTRELRTWVDSVVAALGHINYSAGRRLLLNGLHPTLVASLPTFAAPADQARSDLIELVTRNASVAQVRVLLQNAVAQTQHAHPKVHTQLAAALRTLSALARAGEPKALIEINAWPAPCYADLGIDLTPICFQTPRSRWHMQSTAGDADWEYAFNGITKYVGPAAGLMMAAGTLRIMRNLTVHERLPADGDAMRFVPAVRFQNGNAKLVR